MKKIVVLFFFLVPIVMLVSKSFAYDSVSLAKGWQVHARSDESIPLMARYQHQINLLSNKRIEFVFSLEPSLITFSGGQYGAAVGTVFENKFRLSSNLKLVISYGCGVIWTSSKLVDEALMFNFTPQGGVGIEYKGNIFEVRYWHASNAGIKDPNGGIDDILLLLGAKIF